MTECKCQIKYKEHCQSLLLENIHRKEIFVFGGEWWWTIFPAPVWMNTTLKFLPLQNTLLFLCLLIKLWWKSPNTKTSSMYRGGTLAFDIYVRTAKCKMYPQAAPIILQHSSTKSKMNGLWWKFFLIIIPDQYSVPLVLLMRNMSSFLLEIFTLFISCVILVFQ